MQGALTNDEGAEFAFVAETPKRSTAFSRAWQVIRDMQELASEHGTLIPANLLIPILGVTKQRVSILLTEGKLHVVAVAGKNYITENSLKEYIVSVSGGGGHIQLPKSNLDAFKRSMAFAKSSVAEKK